jgi:hypothetical protein
MTGKVRKEDKEAIDEGREQMRKATSGDTHDKDLGP